MSGSGKKLYVGCALTGATENFKASVESFKDKLRAEGYEVFNFTGLLNGDAAEVYNWDIGHCVRDCDAFIGICDHPSLGLGFEIGEALRMGKRVVLIAHKDATVTRLVLGAADVEENVSFHRYDELEKDGLKAVLAELAD